MGENMNDNAKTTQEYAKVFESQALVKAIAEGNLETANQTFAGIIGRRTRQLIFDRKHDIANGLVVEHTDASGQRLEESAPPDAAIEDWIVKNKKRFKSQYGEKEYKAILYGKAWDMYNRKQEQDK